MRKIRMKNFRFTPWFVVLAFAASLASCSEDGGGGDGGPATLETGLFGTIEGASGALSGVTVEVNGVSATTDSSGEYVIQTDTGPAVVRFKADGYLPTVRKVTIADGSPTAAHLTLQPRATATPVNADDGGMVSGARSASVTIEPGALSGPGGTSVTGMVDVYLTPVDPSDSDEVQALTGSFEGQSNAGTSLLESFGMVDVTIMQGDDELQVAPGETLEIRIPAPAGAVPSELPATMPLWSLDEDSGQWVEEGTATLDEVTNTYVGQISHMSAWNADKEAEATCITGLAVDSNGDPIAGAEVDAKGLDYFGSSTGSTGADGRFYIPVRKSSEVSVAVSHDNEGGQIRNVTSGGEDTTVPPTAGDPRCTDVGTFTIQRGVVLLADGTVVTCDNARAAGVFSGTCAEGFGDIFLCWNPQGSCTVGTTGVVYENGARVDTNISGNSQFISSSGEVCGTSMLDLGSTEDEIVVNFTNQSDETYTLVTGASSDITIICPNEETVTLTAEEQQVLEACTNSAGDGESVCEVDIGPIDGTCVSDADCLSLPGLEVACCDIGIGTMSCLPRSVCDSL
jgi:hypothetical protein